MPRQYDIAILNIDFETEMNREELEQILENNVLNPLRHYSQFVLFTPSIHNYGEDIIYHHQTRRGKHKVSYYVRLKRSIEKDFGLRLNIDNGLHIENQNTEIIRDCYESFGLNHLRGFDFSASRHWKKRINGLPVLAYPWEDERKVKWSLGIMTFLGAISMLSLYFSN